ncbi:MAG: hypothetical protein ACLQOO_29775 [Terriglobia bacterium]
MQSLQRTRRERFRNGCAARNTVGSVSSAGLRDLQAVVLHVLHYDADVGGAVARQKKTIGVTTTRPGAMKVRCDRDYASFLMSRYQGKFLVDWRNGIMNVTRPMIDLAGICEE